MESKLAREATCVDVSAAEIGELILGTVVTEEVGETQTTQDETPKFVPKIPSSWEVGYD